MTLTESYRSVKPGLVFFTPSRRDPNATKLAGGLPPILGTGFVVGEGTIVTAGHVAEKLTELPTARSGDRSSPPALANVFVDYPGHGIVRYGMPVMGIVIAPRGTHAPDIYGEVIPDLAVVRVHVTGLRTLKLAQGRWPLGEGERLAVAGFPQGTELLGSEQAIDQMCPTLQEGIVAAVLPYDSPNARGFMLNMLSYGGSSGSPVFDPTNAEVVGVLTAGRDHVVVGRKGREERIPQPFTYCAPSQGLSEFIATDFAKDPRVALPANAPTLMEAIAREMTRRGLQRPT